MGTTDKKKVMKPRGTPIFEEDAAKKARVDQNRADSKEISKQQGTHKETPQRDHERERVETTPAPASGRAREGAGKSNAGMKGQGGGVPGGIDQDVPLRPPQGHAGEDEIDEGKKAR
jgi:hypothetical protein